MIPVVEEVAQSTVDSEESWEEAYERDVAVAILDILYALRDAGMISGGIDPTDCVKK